MFVSLTSIGGSQPFNDWFTPDTTQRHPLGTLITAVDPYWGTGTFMYVEGDDTILKGSICQWDETYKATLFPVTTLSGYPWGVAMMPMANPSYGWLQIQGRAVYKTSATVAADAIVAIAAAGIIAGTATGKQLTGVRNRVAATGTSTVVGSLVKGSNTIRTAGYDGIFCGMILSGTGVASSAVVAKLDPDGCTIYTGTAIGTATGKDATATGGGITVTGTYTGFGSGMINYPTTMVAVA